MADHTAAAASFNAHIRHRGNRRIDAGHLSAPSMNAFIAGRSMTPDSDPDLDQVLALKHDDAVGYLALPADVRAQATAYANALATAAALDAGADSC